VIGRLTRLFPTVPGHVSISAISSASPITTAFTERSLTLFPSPLNPLLQIHALWLIYKLMQAKERFASQGGYVYRGSGTYEPIESTPYVNRQQQHQQQQGHVAAPAAAGYEQPPPSVRFAVFSDVVCDHALMFSILYLQYGSVQRS
jgi:hypothetical protein